MIVCESRRIGVRRYVLPMSLFGQMKGGEVRIS